MTDLLRRLVLLTVAATIAIAPLTHELCQVSCAKPASSTTQAAAGHEHCAQAAIDEHGVRMSAARVSDCRTQTTDAMWTSVLVKVPAPAAAILPLHDKRIVNGVRPFAGASSSPPQSVSVPARTQLRV